MLEDVISAESKNYPNDVNVNKCFERIHNAWKQRESVNKQEDRKQKRIIKV